MGEIMAEADTAKARILELTCVNKWRRLVIMVIIFCRDF